MGYQLKNDGLPSIIISHGGKMKIADIGWGLKYTIENPQTGYRESIRLRKEDSGYRSSSSLEYLFNDYLYHHGLCSIRGI